MKYATFVGFDVHKDTIAVAVAKEGREAAESLGIIVNNPGDSRGRFLQPSLNLTDTREPSP